MCWFEKRERLQPKRKVAEFLFLLDADWGKLGRQKLGQKKEGKVKPHEPGDSNQRRKRVGYWMGIGSKPSLGVMREKRTSMYELIFLTFQQMAWTCMLLYWCMSWFSWLSSKWRGLACCYIDAWADFLDFLANGVDLYMLYWCMSWFSWLSSKWRGLQVL